MSIFSFPEDTLQNPLDQVLYTVPNTDTDITWADAVEGTLIMGATGSGKSSGAGRYIALSMLNAGFGFCVLCAKKDEKDRWVDYAREARRYHDVVVFDKKSNLQFNVLDYEMKRGGEGAGDVVNVSNMLVNLNEQIRILQSGSARGDEKFWDNSLKRLISRTVSLLKFTQENINIYNIRKLIAESFTSESPDFKLYNLIKENITTKDKIPEQERENAKENLQIMIAGNYFVKLLEKAEALPQTQNLLMTVQYWKHEFANLSEKTRSIIIESVLAIIEPFLVDGILQNQFSKGLSDELLPENIIKNKKIVIIDFSTKEYGLAGMIANTIYKLTFQSAMERRDVEKENDPKPVSLWIDEYQSFCNPNIDSQFQATARSSWVATVYITQNINGIYQVMGEHQPEARAKALLSNINLKYFASNSDFDTNSWASSMIGTTWVNDNTLNYDGKAELTGKSQKLERRPKIEIDQFTTLKTGRAVNDNIVESVVFKAGKTWGENEENFAVVSFKQK
ncbi:type IV secretory system conjugative DNA transfer family protein [Tenacibaculum agarivorans]|uniref:type IV secretory system conjugative DNA transfer family protein n=1 Tax=Tenacibaculum agarivorans TaxID=1908389 RepID=UPI00094BABCA|nr:TraM recognition domain-containing protein [Tenacibaculum agarivorans]